MNYDTVILELLTRVQSLERSLKDLEGKESVMDGEAYQDILARLCRLEAALGQEGGENSRPDKSEKALSTQQVYSYILQKKREASEAGGKTLVLRAGDIERAFGVSNRIPIVVNAMKQAKAAGDETLSATQSGYSASFEVRYHLGQEEGNTTMRGRVNQFKVRKGLSPYNESILPTLKVQAGQEYLLVYDIKNRCVGVVYCHSENRPAAANGQAEICFFDCYYAELGRWHRMFCGGYQGGERIAYETLVREVEQHGEFDYSGYIRM